MVPELAEDCADELRKSTYWPWGMRGTSFNISIAGVIEQLKDVPLPLTDDECYTLSLRNTESEPIRPCTVFVEMVRVMSHPAGVWV
jgi:hypothetical protein